MKEVIKLPHVLFWHNHYPAKANSNPYFGRGGTIHRLTEKMTKRQLYWQFIGGFINDESTNFWKHVVKADVLFCLPANMDYYDNAMHWDGAEISALEIIYKIKEKNPKIKIFFFENEVIFLEEELSSLGEFITDLKGDEEVIRYLKEL